MKRTGNRKWNIVAAVGLGVISFAIFVSFLANTAKLKKELYQETKNSVMDINAQVADNIVYRMQTDLQLIEELAGSIGNIPRFSIIEAVLERKRKSFELEEIVVLSRDKVLFPERYDSKMLEKWKSENEEIWYRPMISCFESHKILFSSPILKDGRSTGHIVVGSKTYSGLQEVMSKVNYQNQSMNILIDAKGEMITAPVGEDLLGLMNTPGGWEQVLAAIHSRFERENEEANELIFTMDSGENEKILVSVHRLAVNDWMQICFVPWSLREKEYSYHLVIYFWLVMAAGILATGVLWYIVRLQKEARQKLERIAYCDLLTGGITNDAFQIRCLEHLRRTGWSSYGIIYFNLRDFKYINESWGIDSGNKALKYIYRTFQNNIEADELVARSEVDHFFLLLRGQTEEELAKRVDGLVKQVNSFTSPSKDEYKLKFEIGGCMIQRRSGGIQSIQDRARRAAQFHEDVNVCTFYNENVIAKINHENRLNTLFEQSIRNHDFEMYLQPKVYLQQNRRCAAEALVRWIHPEEGMIFPSDFIPLFEKNGKICELDFYMFEEVCKLIDRWRTEGRPLCEISVNLSRAHFKKMDSHFTKRFCELKEKYQLPDGLLQIELTETTMLSAQQAPCVTEAIKNFHEAGFSCALDDFGSGYSSLSMLKEFKIDTIKLDRGFFVNESKKSRIVVANMIHLAHDMDIQIVAEGIEEEQQVHALYELGCDLIQGYFYSKPLPVQEFEEWQDKAQGMQPV